MDFDFALILTVLTLIAGLICVADKLIFKQHKKAQDCSHPTAIQRKYHHRIWLFVFSCFGCGLGITLFFV